MDLREPRGDAHQAARRRRQDEQSRALLAGAAEPAPELPFDGWDGSVSQVEESIAKLEEAIRRKADLDAAKEAEGGEDAEVAGYAEDGAYDDSYDADYVDDADNADDAGDDGDDGDDDDDDA